MTEKQYIITEIALDELRDKSAIVCRLVGGGFGIFFSEDECENLPLAPDCSDCGYKQPYNEAYGEGLIQARKDEDKRIESLKAEIREQTEKVLSPYEARMALLDILDRIDKMQTPEDSGSEKRGD